MVDAGCRASTPRHSRYGTGVFSDRVFRQEEDGGLVAYHRPEIQQRMQTAYCLRISLRKMGKEGGGARQGAEAQVFFSSLLLSSLELSDTKVYEP